MLAMMLVSGDARRVLYRIIMGAAAVVDADRLAVLVSSS
jgi:hypothetical protein